MLPISSFNIIYYDFKLIIRLKTIHSKSIFVNKIKIMAKSQVKQVVTYEVFFETGIIKNQHFPRVYELNKNLCYGFTYIEYLDSILRAEESFVVKSQLLKSYVLTGMSLVEAILFYLIKSNDLQKKENYEIMNTYVSNEQDLNGEKVKIETRLLKKLEQPKPVEMNLDSMLKKAESKKLLGDDVELYRKLNHLRKLRNKVHIHIAEYLKHDFNSFKVADYETMKDILLSIVESNIFNPTHRPTNEIFDFLK